MAHDVLRKLSLFSRLTEEALDTVARRTVIQTVPRGRRLFQRGDPCHGLYVVVEGTIRVYRANRQGKEQTLHVQGPGQSIAEVPLFDGGVYPASARAEEESRVLFLPLADFQWLYRNCPEISESVIRELGGRLRRMVRLIEKISLKDVLARVATTLLEYAERREEPVDGLEFALPRTQEEMAAELATTRESVARALAGLRRSNIIAQKGARVRILDLVRLENAASGEES